MAADQFVNVTYRGLDIGKRLRISQFGPMSAYLEHSTPMPVGTELAIHTDEGVRVPVRVLRVQEQVAGAENPPGMRVAAARLDDAAGTWWQSLVTTSDPQIPEPLSGAAEQDTEIQAEAESAEAEADSAEAEADSAEAEAGSAEAEADSAEAELQAEAEPSDADQTEAEPSDADQADAEPSDADQADTELQAGAGSADAEADSVEAEDEPGDADLAVQDPPASREAAPTEQMDAVDIQAIMASASSASAEPAEDDDESPEEDGRASSDDSEDSPSGGKKRRRGRRRKGRG